MSRSVTLPAVTTDNRTSAPTAAMWLTGVAVLATLGLFYLLRDLLLPAQTWALADVPTTITLVLAWTVVAFPALCLAISTAAVTARPLRRPWGHLASAGILLATAQLAVLTSRHRPLDRGRYRPESPEHRAASHTPAGEALTEGAMGALAGIAVWALLFIVAHWAWRRSRGQRGPVVPSLFAVTPQYRRMLAVGSAAGAVAGLAVALLRH
ncbi:hypothetical protein Cci01nite_74010 [Catellatospora citrea]|uniref:Uncharacterized protein n=1 Tax=Catellatospora citrea TaxID=53366 RepID=A0A8J3KLK9_9ACTN|nr:hypothetical protein C8E86_3029 [Catellatospora citrea]GIG02308.1 hypothetical protein Cci01nite_74010 [Catellatospora citrea]